MNIAVPKNLQYYTYIYMLFSSAGSTTAVLHMVLLQYYGFTTLVCHLLLL